MGTIIPSPDIAAYGGIIANAPANRLAEYARVAQLKAATALQQQQTQQQEQSFPVAQQQAQATLEQTQQLNQVRQRQMQDQDALTKTLAQYDPEKHSIDDIPKLVAQNGGSGDAAAKAQAGLVQQRQNLSKLSDEQFARQQKIADLTEAVHDRVKSAKPEDKQDEYTNGLQSLAQAGVDVSKEPAQYPGDDVFDRHLPAIRLHSAIVAEANKERELKAKEVTAQASADRAAKPPAEEQELQASYSSWLEANGLKRSAANEWKFRQIYAGMHRAPKNDQATSDAIEAAAQSLASMNPKDLTRLKDVASLRGDQRLLIYNRAKQINPNFSTAEVDRKAKMLDSFTNGKDAQQLQSFGTFLEHAGEASRVVNDFRTTSIPLVNTPLNKLRDKFGDASYSQMIASLEPVRKEFEGFLLGGRALYGDDRKAAETILSDASSPAQIQAALKQMGHTVKARQNEINSRFKNTMGADIQEVLGPMSAEALEGARQIGIEMGQAKTQASAGGHQIGDIIVQGGHRYKVTAVKEGKVTAAAPVQ